MNHAQSRTRFGCCALLATSVMALAACNAPAPRPAPPPLPQTSPEPPPPPAADASMDADERSASRNQSSEPSTESAAAPAAYLPPSADAAEVEVEEVPVGGEPPAAQASSAEPMPRAESDGMAGTRQPRASGAPSLARPLAAGERDPVEATGGGSAPAAPAATDPDMVGPRMNVGARTEREQLAALEDELDGKLAEFDELMRRARAEADREKMERSRGGARGGVAGGRGARLDGDPENRGAGGAAPTGTGMGNTPDLSGSTSGAPTPVAVAARPADIPDGRDDDIVARQLREAATKESDPILREKLWEEYRKYKAGL